MTTAFQGNAFQPNAFQIAGGVAATEFEATIGFTQDSDGLSVTTQFPAEAVGGWPIAYGLTKLRQQKKREEARLRELEAEAEESNRRIAQVKNEDAKQKAKDRLQKIITRQLEQERLIELLTAEIAREMREEEDDAIAQILMAM